ncbi:MAG: hypothetical protein C4293_18885, partial [Nitrospiraceae bacterium]
RRPYRSPRLLREGLRLIPRGAALLDLGCGPGQDARYLRRAGYRVVGLDLAWSLLHAARPHNRHLLLIQADMRQMAIRAGAFDGIWAAAS